MSAPAKILELVDLFRRNADAYHAPQYNEAMVRQEFINPLFKSLGWDMDNEQGYAEAYKDVIHEAAIKIGGATKAPDYCFRIGGSPKFFLEAKRPSVAIKDDPAPAYQLRRYAWTGKLPLSILTDFEEFAVYDCRIKPAHTDKAGVARILYLRSDDYPDRWEDIAGVFSREAILKGSFDKFAESNKAKRGTAAVDTAFLQEIESWREVLARNLALRNSNLSQRELNYAVQVTIDRIIFLRMCEDRGIEPYGQLQKLLQGADIYQGLLDLYRKADDRYNSGLFHFHAEKGRPEAPDTLTTSLILDDKPLKDILRGLYYPECPYEFSVLSGEILGQVYEQFLGKVIRLTAGHRAQVEDKPEVRKAGGVYYTPTYIVDYIVKQTVGKLLGEPAASAAGLTPKQASRLRILDPACGSGSFLLGAYQLLLDWHRDRYLEAGPKKHTKELYQGTGGAWRLTTAEKKRILLANIYGVDIDPQAVEVTKLSLLLKVLEGESEQTLQSQLRMFHERALPDLSSNIQCGNSLIGPDFYEGQQMTMFDDEERYRINVFDWEAAFPWLRDTGGFDVVIGNPPYVFTRNEGIDESQKQYFYAKYRHQSAQLNTFGIFLERSYNLMRQQGILGFITPNNWLTISSFAPLRQFLLQNAGEVRIVNILDRVFAAAHVDTAITVFEKTQPTTITVCEMTDGQETFTRNIRVAAVTGPEFIIQISLLKDLQSLELLERIEARSQPLGTCATVSTGLKAYQTGKGNPPQSDKQKKGRVFHAKARTDNTFGRYLEGVDVRRYNLSWSGEYLSYGDWLAEPRKSVPFRGDRLLVRQIPSKPPYLVHGVFTSESFYNDINSMVIFAAIPSISLKYLLGLINSRLLSFWFLRTYDKLQRKIFPVLSVKT
jgi:predicted type IV restriction endonuclease